MGMPDVVTKMYIRENSVFADVVNYFIYGGKQVIAPEALTEMDPTGLALLPVITFVLFFNDEVWDGPRTIHEMMKTKNKELLEYVQDYRIHLVEPASLTKDDFKKFRTNLREVLEYIKCSNHPEQLKALIEGNPRMEHIDVKAAEVISAVTRTPVRIEKGAEHINMCRAIEEMMKQSRNEGKIEGERNGRKEGKREGKREGGIDMLVKLVGASILSEEVAAKQAGMSVEQFKKEIEKRRADKNTVTNKK